MADGDDDGENEVFSDETDSEEEQSPILIAKNTGANLRSPAGAAINCKRKLYVIFLSKMQEQFLMYQVLLGNCVNSL